MGKACPFSSFAIQNLIKIAIFKIMVLHDTLVYDSEKWSALPALSSGIFSFVFGAKLSSSCYIGDKGVYKKALLITVL